MLGITAAGVGTFLKGASSAVGIGSGLASMFGGNSNSMDTGEMVQAQKELMDYQQQKNLQNSWVDYQYNKDFQNRQFNMNKWFTQHEYQNAVSDLRAAGLNPLLGVPSGNSGQVGGAGVSTPGTGLLDPSSAVAAKAQMKQADTAMKLGVVQTIGDLLEKASASAKNIQDARVKGASVSNIKADTALKILNQEAQRIINSNLDKSQKSEILKRLAEADAVIRQTQVQEALAPSQQFNNVVSAKAARTNAAANMTNATQGNPTKVVTDFSKGLFGTDSKGAGKFVNYLIKDYINTTKYIFNRNNWRKDNW